MESEEIPVVIVILTSLGVPVRTVGPIDSYEDAVMYATDNYTADTLWAVIPLECPA